MIRYCTGYQYQRRLALGFAKTLVAATTGHCSAENWFKEMEMKDVIVLYSVSFLYINVTFCAIILVSTIESERG
jgi:hypothetical protein